MFVGHNRKGVKDDSAIKVNFGQKGDVTGGLGPNPYQFSLLANVEHQIVLPQPFVFSTSTDWSPYVREEGDNELVFIDSTYGFMLIEQNIDRQWFTWRFIFDYSRADASTDERLTMRFHNPYSGFSQSSQLKISQAKTLDEGTLNINIISDIASIPEAGSGNGYQVFFESTTDVDMSIRSVVRKAHFKSIVKIF